MPRSSSALLPLSKVWTSIFASLLASLFLLASPLLAQQPPTLVTQPINNSVRTVLPGNVHPLARAEFDRGEAPPDLPLKRILLVLKRSPQQEAVLRGLVDDQQDKYSASYHQWLTPEEFGARFGPADSDIAAVTNWLTASGFEVAQVGKGRTVIEFSGTAGLLKQAFGTALHKFVVDGEEHWANASDPSIPTALTPVVAGFASLNNFPRWPHHTVVGPFTENYHGQGGPLPLFTFNFNGSTLYGVGPADFATIYNVQALWNAGIDGTGQTIAIVGESNINVQDVRDFRSIFGLPANDPHIILDGPDPGLQPDETEAVLDVSWSGAVAKNATIDFVVSQSTETSFGTDLSAFYIVNNNLAPVMSESYGACEAALGTGGNQFFYFMWEQAAAQGITVLISAGDGGSAGCDNFNTASAAQFGLAVSGYASTPFNVAVGGTDFDQFSNASTYWNSTNNATTGESALSYIREEPWNDSCAGIEIGACTPANSNFFNIVGGSGGPSSCVQQSGGICTAAYAKPAWQTGTGTQTDNVRDLPDVSLFASNGFNNSFYILCEADLVSPCSLNPFSFLGIGGTSASSPALAGIMALVNQKTGMRQGNANYALYKLAAGSGNSCDSSTVALTGNSCLFYDVTKGNNSVPCVAGSPNCGPAAAGATYGVLVDSKGKPAWTTTAGYDMATGLGSVNAANLVNNWSTAVFAASKTTLTLNAGNPVNITHGQTVNVSVTVAPKSGPGTPTGDVALIGGPNGQNLGIDWFNLTNGVATFTSTLLPGGSYNITAHYQGDQTFGASDSAGVAVTVSVENSSVYMPGVVNGTDVNGNPTYTNNVTYGTGAFDLYLLRADVKNAGGNFCGIGIACATGTIAFTDNGSPLDASPYKLNSFGNTEDQTIQLTGGSHTLVANYSGDTSYKAGTSGNTVINVAKATSAITNVQVNPTSVLPNQNFTVSATVTTTVSYGVAPTGTVTFLANGTPLGTATTTPTNGNFNAGVLASLGASLTTSIATVGNYNITATYSGDGNYTNVTTSNSAPITVTVPPTFTFVSTGSASHTVLSGQTTLNYSFTATPTSASTFASAVNLSCSSFAPADPTLTSSSCTFSPATIAAGSGTSTVTMTISSKGPNSGTGSLLRQRSDSRVPWLPLTLPLAGVVMVGFARRKMSRAATVVGMCLMLALAGFLIACGSSSPPVSITSVTGSSSSIYPQNAGWTNATATFTAVLANDSGNKGVTWAVTTPNGGTIVSADATHGTYTPPTIAAGLPSSVTITATAVADTSKTGTASIALNPTTVPGTYTVTVTASETGATSQTPNVTLVVK